MPKSFVALDRASAIEALAQLAHARDDDAPRIYVAILEALNASPNGGRSIRLPIVNGEPAFLSRLHVRCGLLGCVRQPRYVAIYRHPDEDVHDEVKVYCPDRPPKRKTLSGPGGRRKYVRISSRRLNEGEATMARTATKTRSRTRAKKDEPVIEADELDELEELEELEDEEEAPKPKRSRRTRKAAEPEPDEDDEDDDEDDEDEDDDEEDEEPAPRRRSRSRSRAAKAEPAAKSTRTRSRSTSAKSKTSPTPPTRALKAGKVGVEQVAKLAGVQAKDVRVYFRKNGVEKVDGRYEFTEKQAQAHAKKLKASRK